MTFKTNKIIFIGLLLLSTCMISINANTSDDEDDNELTFDDIDKIFNIFIYTIRGITAFIELCSQIGFINSILVYLIIFFIVGVLLIVIKYMINRFNISSNPVVDKVITYGCAADNINWLLDYE